jgi:hypothetical protein
MQISAEAVPAHGSELKKPEQGANFKYDSQRL